jgi:hypothetical protein
MIIQHYDWKFIKYQIEEEGNKDFKSSEVVKYFQHESYAKSCLENLNNGEEITNGAPWSYELVKI